MVEPPARRPQRYDDDARYWSDEEEAAHADDEYRAQLAAEQFDTDREAAIETMIDWFGENFEDPQNRTPIDSEDSGYIYINGGPFDAGDVIGSQFSDEFEQEWIDAAVEHVTRDGTYDWAPMPGSEFYESGYEHEASGEVTESGGGTERVPIDFFPPNSAIERADIIQRINGRLDDIETQLVTLWACAPPTGHNQPPDEIGLPPYDGEERAELERAIRTTREEIASAEPASAPLKKAESIFRKVSIAILKWLGRKADLAVDESIKAGISVAKWGTVAQLAQGLAADIAQLLTHIIPF